MRWRNVVLLQTTYMYLTTHAIIHRTAGDLDLAVLDSPFLLALKHTYRTH